MICRFYEVTRKLVVDQREEARERAASFARQAASTNYALSMETTQAVAVQAQVLDELRKDKRPPARRSAWLAAKSRRSPSLCIGSRSLVRTPEDVVHQTFISPGGPLSVVKL